ncbi:bifunctional glycosyltransferase/CDP-glycerol:glycerophosphate glycerophosphotransferase [Streptomyces zingiberis]|uniref:Glycosyltransferase n=1 Tax=Streptomyces zingiberis TaxID=2053010 RepID=A0ABX1BZ61_9ACTN|nr:CDP-glycerol glycerophosphotransferase family protein [Streptomyces zingiberis]NJQ01760.1 glycosyltransferase [Streptomyces zingiberis]
MATGEGRRGPDVSVILIVYNDAGRLPAAVRSVLGQTLRAVEVVIVDDHSTDGSYEVARRLAAADPERVRAVRLPANSGGCSAPRNRGIAEARAPWLMFLDSDDELPRHACKSLLLTAERTGADFVTGEVVRVYEDSGTTGLWYPELFADERVIEGIREAPEFFFDHLSTNKLYSAAFVARHRLRFPEGVHYEDQLFSAQAFAHAHRFAVVPWPVYRWRLAAGPGRPSISSSRHLIRNVTDRIAVARMIDDFLGATGNADLRPAKDAKFLRHDLRLHLGDLAFRGEEWARRFAAETVPYLAELAPEALAAQPRDERVCLRLLREGRHAEVRQCARALGRPHLAPRHAVRDGRGRTYWGREVPSGPAADDLDITEWRLTEQPFTGGRIRHEVETLVPEGPLLRLGLRTYDPAGLLADTLGAGRADGLTAEVRLSAGGPALTLPFRYRAAEGAAAPRPGVSGPALSGPDGAGADAPGRDVPGPEAPGPAGREYTAEILLDLRRVPLRPQGFAGRRHPSVVLRRHGLSRSDPLLAPLGLRPLRALLPRAGPLAGHRVSAGCEERGAGRLELVWERAGALRAAAGLAPRLGPAHGAALRLRRRLTGPRLKALVERELWRLPVEKDLVLFEAMEGRGYADSPRRIHEELVRRGLPYRCVWSYTGDRSSFPPGVALVRRGSWAYVRTLARAGTWVDSHGIPPGYAKRPETRYLQTWHGQAVKHMGFDTPELRLGGEEPRRRHREAVIRWDLLVAPSEEFERTFVRANGYTGELLRCGLPRNDVLVRRDEPAQLRSAADARHRLQIPDGRRGLLYAPTFRDGLRGTGDSVRVDLAELVAGVGAEWTVVVRPHPYERFTVPPGLGHAVRDGRGFTEVSDLLLASDALVTDYSSLMFDYALLDRPILLFADDYEEYRGGSRGTYYELPEIAPGPLLSTTAELVTAVRELDRVAAEWAGAHARFRARFTARENGRASGTVVDRLFAEGAR